MPSARRCAAEDCDEFLPPGKLKFHDQRCADRDKNRRFRARKRAAKFEALADEARQKASFVKPSARERVSAAESKDGRATARRGPGYEEFCRQGWPGRIESGELSQAEVIEITGERQANVARWFAAWLEDEARRRLRAQWRPEAEIAELLAAETPEAFAAFRARFFVDEWGAPYVTPEFQMVWVAQVLAALRSGGRLVILSPPRHGKTQLLIHFCVWLICARPNVRIMWIGGNEAIAKQSTGAVLDILENTPELVAAVLGPEGTFKPGTRTGKSWSSERFTVATRQGAGIKSPTMVAVGKGGKLLSRDADLIVADDIIDADSVRSPQQREDDKGWFNTQVSSRKEAHTALMAIGSRQHHEDLWNDLTNNRAFRAIVEHAHDPNCEIRAHQPAPIDDDHREDCPECVAHDRCVLWPGKRTFAFLMDQRVAMDDDRLYEMVYQNITRPDGEEYLTEEDIRACRNYARRIGLEGLPKNTRWRLIAGLDPATAGFQAAVLWAYDFETRKRYLVDLDQQRAGGLPGARRIIRVWHEKYRVKNWVVERNGYQEAILQDRDILDFCATNGVRVEPHYTTTWNKYDPHFGLTKQFDLYRDQLIDLPYGDEEARERTRQLEKQLMSFEGPKTKSPHDLLMAGWFPESTIRRWRMEEQTMIEVEYDQTGYDVAALGDIYKVA